MAEKKIVAQFIIEGQSAKQELDSLRAAEEKFLQSGNTLGVDMTQRLTEIEAGVGKAFAKIESSGKVSQSQFDALVSKLASVKEAIEATGKPLDELPEQFTKALTTAETQIQALAGGMSAAAARTEGLKEEFEKAAIAAKDLGDDTAKAAAEIKASADRADAAFEKFTQTLKENPKEALEQLPRVAGAVIQLRQEIERTQKSGGVVDEKDLARLQQFETRLVETRESAKRLGVEINAATGGVGGQIDGITDAVQGLAGSFGPAGQAVGNAAGQIGQMAMGAQRAKDVLGGLNLNTLSLGASSTTLAVQVGAVGAAIVAAVAAGKALAETNDENKQTIDDLKDTLGGILPSLDGMKDSLNGVQMAGQNALASLMNGDWGDARRDLEAMGAAWKNGRDAGKLYYDLINQGVNELEASAIAAAQNREAVDLYSKAMALGAPGVRAWNEAVANSGGTAAGLTRELAVLKIDLEDEARISALTAEANKNAAKAREEAAKKAKEHADAVRDYISVQERANQIAVDASMSSMMVQQATGGTTEAINILVRSIASMADESDRNSVALGSLATQLQNTLNQTDGLTKAERDRIQVMVDLAKNANSLTDAEQKRAIALATAIQNGAAATTALKDQAAASKEVADATSALAQATSDAATATDSYRASVEQELAAVQAELQTRGVRLDQTRQQSEVSMEAASSTAYLLEKERQLSEQLAGPSLTSWSAAAEQKTEQVSATAELSALIEKEKAATSGLATSTSELKVTREAGIVTIKQANTESSTFVKTLEDGRKTITNLSEAEKAAAASGITLGEGMEKIKKPASEAAAVMQQLDTVVASLASNLETIEARMDAVNKRMREMKDAAAAAAGGEEGATPEATS